MSISVVVTRGYGSFGSGPLVVTRGYTTGTSPPPPPPPPLLPPPPFVGRVSLANGNPWLFQTLRPAFVNEDFTDRITLKNPQGSIADWTLAAHLYNSSAVELPGAATTTIIDPIKGIVLVSIPGLMLTTVQDMTLVVYRTDTAARTLIAWATIEVVNPDEQLGWDQGIE